jgi:pilus assembly protein CpaC
MGFLPRFGGPPRGWLVPLAQIVVLGAVCRVSAGQSAPEGPANAPLPSNLTSPGSPPSIGGFAPRLPAVPSLKDRPDALSFIEGLGESTGLIEVKVGQGRFISLKEDLAVIGQPAPFVAVGDPSVADFYQIGPRQLRLIGKKLGTTDLSITTGSGKTYDYELQVVADLDVLRAQLKQMFPDAQLKLVQVRTRVIVEGQARDTATVSRIIATIDSYIRTVQSIYLMGQVGDVRNTMQLADPNASPPSPRGDNSGPPQMQQQQNQNQNQMNYGQSSGLGTGGGAGAVAANQIATNSLQVINLIRVPTSQQVLLKVRVAEMNRTALRQVGADFLASIPQFHSLIGTQIAGNGFAGSLGTGAAGTVKSGLGLGPEATLIGTFGNGQFQTVLTALRKNNIVKVLAEPNLVAMNGYQAAFLAGGEFPVPTFSGVGAGAVGGGGTSGTQFKQYGVRLSFLPIILDNDTIRLSVNPEVSSVDFSVGTTLVPGGSPVPGLNTRSAYTTVELKQGETLAIAGLLQLTLDAQTQRIPGLGDLPYIGAFFSNTSSQRVEKELVVTVTPYIVEAMAPGQVPAGPGDEVNEPNDLEFFFMNRIEGRTGMDKRSTTTYDDPFHLIRHQIIEKKYLVGPSGYSK